MSNTDARRGDAEPDDDEKLGHGEDNCNGGEGRKRRKNRIVLGEIVFSS